MGDSTITIELYFHDIAMIRLAGIIAPETGQMHTLVGAVPMMGDIVRFAGMNYKNGELATFRVASRAHLFGGEYTQRLQMNLELVVLHQP